MTQNVDLSGPQSGNPGCRRDQLTVRRQDRGDADKILLLNIRSAERIFECSEQMPVNADAAIRNTHFGMGNIRHRS